jgi:hypothetical protein
LISAIALILYAIAALCVFRWLYNRSRPMPRSDEDTCAKCGYIVRGLTRPTCPECGADLAVPGAIVTPEQSIRPALGLVVRIGCWLVLMIVFAVLVQVLWIDRMAEIFTITTSREYSKPASQAYNAVDIVTVAQLSARQVRSGQTSISVKSLDGKTASIQFDAVSDMYQGRAVDAPTVLQLLRSLGINTADPQVVREAEVIVNSATGYTGSGGSVTPGNCFGRARVRSASLGRPNRIARFGMYPIVAAWVIGTGVLLNRSRSR